MVMVELVFEDLMLRSYILHNTAVAYLLFNLFFNFLYLMNKVALITGSMAILH